MLRPVLCRRLSPAPGFVLLNVTGVLLDPPVATGANVIVPPAAGLDVSGQQRTGQDNSAASYASPAHCRQRVSIAGKRGARTATTRTYNPDRYTLRGGGIPDKAQTHGRRAGRSWCVCARHRTAIDRGGDCCTCAGAAEGVAVMVHTAGWRRIAWHQ